MCSGACAGAKEKEAKSGAKGAKYEVPEQYKEEGEWPTSAALAHLYACCLRAVEVRLCRGCVTWRYRGMRMRMVHPERDIWLHGVPVRCIPYMPCRAMPCHAVNKSLPGYNQLGGITRNGVDYQATTNWVDYQASKVIK